MFRIKPLKNSISRLRELYSIGGPAEIIRGVKDFLYYNSRDLAEEAHIGLLKWRYGQYMDIELPGYKLTVDLDDRGIGRELALNGLREPHSYKTYRRCIESLETDDGEELVVLEIGANIGYYAMLPAILRDDARIYAAELSEANTELLRRNVRANNVADRFTIDNVAISNETGTGSVYISESSNCHSLNEIVNPKLMADEKQIAITAANEWLARHGVEQAEIDVLRMDVEGYEYEILDALDEISPRLVHIEIHPKLMTDEELDFVLERLNAFGLEPQCIAAKEKIFERLDDIRDVPSEICPEYVLSEP